MTRFFDPRIRQLLERLPDVGELAFPEDALTRFAEAVRDLPPGERKPLAAQLLLLAKRLYTAAGAQAEPATMALAELIATLAEPDPTRPNDEDESRRRRLAHAMLGLNAPAQTAPLKGQGLLKVLAE